MNESLFNQPDPVVDDNKDYLTDLVGEGKKFKDTKDLAKGKYHADLTIETMKRQQDQLREDYERLLDESRARAKLESLIEQLNKKPDPTPEPKVEDTTTKPAMSLEEYEALMERKLSDYETRKKQSENLSLVEKTLKQRFGDRYTDVLNNLVEDLGVTKDFIDFNAKNNPKVLLRMLDEKPSETFQAPARSTQRQTHFSAKEEERTWSYYQNLKRTDPKLYRDPKTTNQMISDYERLGTKFEDGDFHSSYRR